MKQSNNQEKWYDNKLVVFLLLIIFFPIGLYALWKNKNISKIFKIGVTTFYLVLVFILGGDKEEKNKENVNTILPSEINTDVKKNKVIVEPTKQEIFISKKIELLKSDYLNTTNNAKKSVFLNRTKNFTKDFLKKENNVLKDWDGTISRIQLGAKKNDIKLLKKGLTPNQVKEKDPNDRPIEIIIEVENKNFDGHSFYISANQTQNKQFKGGIKKTNPIYNDLFNFENGQKIKFSAKVVDFKEFNTKFENSIILNIELTKLQPIK